MATGTPDRSRRRDQRQADILDLVMSTGEITAEALSDRLGVTPMTIYRDLAALEAENLITRTHGAVHAPASSLNELASRLRLQTNPELKQRLATAALAWVSRGDAVLLDDSTTSTYLFPGLADLTPLTVVTNARFIEAKSLEHPEIRLIQLGGDYVQWADAYYSPVTSANLTDIAPDVCIMSCTGIRGTDAHHPDASVAAIKAQMVRSAKRSVLVVDHTKFQRPALHRMCSIGEFDIVVTDADAPAESLGAIRALGTEVVVA